MPQIKLYKTPICPYCNQALALLKQKGVAGFVEQIDITIDPNLRDEMLAKSGGRRTVPQIFINDKHVGGCDDLYALDAAGELDALLEN